MSKRRILNMSLPNIPADFDETERMLHLSSLVPFSNMCLVRKYEINYLLLCIVKTLTDENATCWLCSTKHFFLLWLIVTLIDTFLFLCY